MNNSNKTAVIGRPFPKGVSGNPNGRPKKEFSMTESFKEILFEKDPTTKIKKYRIILDKAVSMAMRGDNDMIKYIINRLEGMPQGSAPYMPIDKAIIVQPLLGGRSSPCPKCGYNWEQNEDQKTD